MNTGKGILLKLISAVLFAVMSALIRYLGARYPIGEVVFYRSAFAMIPVLGVYALRGELAAVVRTERPFGQAGRGAHQYRRHVLQLRRAGAAAIDRSQRHQLYLAADQRRAGGAGAQGARARLSLVGGDDRLYRRARRAVAASHRRRIDHRHGERDQRCRRALCAGRLGMQRRHGDPDPPPGAAAKRRPRSCFISRSVARSPAS